MIPEHQIKIETMRGKGAGGQHKNKTDSCVRATHIPTGLSVTIDGRKQAQNKKEAIKQLNTKFKELQLEQKAKQKKNRRDKAIHNTEIIRTYDFKRQVVKDHRSKKSAPLNKVLYKGDLDSLK